MFALTLSPKRRRNPKKRSPLLYLGLAALAIGGFAYASRKTKGSGKGNGGSGPGGGGGVDGGVGPEGEPLLPDVQIPQGGLLPVNPISGLNKKMVTRVCKDLPCRVWLLLPKSPNYWVEKTLGPLDGFQVGEQVGEAYVPSVTQGKHYSYIAMEFTNYGEGHFSIWRGPLGSKTKLANSLHVAVIPGFGGA